MSMPILHDARRQRHQEPPLIQRAGRQHVRGEALGPGLRALSASCEEDAGFAGVGGAGEDGGLRSSVDIFNRLK